MQITEMNLLSCPGSDVMTHHHTAEHEFHYIIRGHGIFTDRDRDLPMEDNCLFYSAPNSDHTVENRHPSGDFTFYFVRFLPGPDCRQLMADLAGIFAAGPVTAPASTAALFEKIRIDTAGGDPHLRAAAALRFRAFIHELCAGQEHGSAGSMNPQVMAAVRLLQQNIPARFSLDDLSRQVGLEKSYLIRLFKKEMGTTPQQYRMKFKIDSAAYLLRHTDRTISRIAEELGFYDEFYFSRMFKRMTGMAPSRFRKQ